MDKYSGSAGGSGYKGSSGGGGSGAGASGSGTGFSGNKTGDKSHPSKKVKRLSLCKSCFKSHSKLSSERSF